MKANDLLSVALLKSSLRRFWPLWLAIFVALVLLVDAPIYSVTISAAGRTDALFNRLMAMESLWYTARFGSLVYGVLTSIVVAASLDEYLFDGRAATFVGSVPLRRTTVYVTSFVAGLIALCGVLALASLCLVPLRIVAGSIFSLAELGQWYVLTVAITFVMYALAQLACHLSGAWPVAIMLYGVLTFLAACLEAAVKLAVASLQYGMGSSPWYLYWLSPAIRLGQATFMGSGHAPDWPIIVLYVLIALGAAAGTGALFAQRDLEAAGESVAFSSVRPVLKYLAGVSMALLFSSVYCSLRFIEAPYGIPVTALGAAGILLSLVAGGTLGVLFSEMIMSRSAHVLGRCWKGALALTCVSVVFVGGCWLDVFGVAHRIPDPSEVREVHIASGYAGEVTIASQEGIAAVCDLHRALLAYGGGRSTNNGYDTITLAYQLSNGRTLERSYPMWSNYTSYLYEGTSPDEGAELVEQYMQIADTLEGRASRFAKVLDPGAQLSFQLEYSTNEERYEYSNVILSPDEQADFVENALRPDLLEEPAGMCIRVYDLKSDEDAFDATIYVYDLEDRITEKGVCTFSLQLGEKATPHIVSWLQQHYPEIELQKVVAIG